jgi:hypothetical protein
MKQNVNLKFATVTLVRGASPDDGSNAEICQLIILEYFITYFLK